MRDANVARQMLCLDSKNGGGKLALICSAPVQLCLDSKNGGGKLGDHIVPSASRFALIPKTGVANSAPDSRRCLRCFALIPKTGVANFTQDCDLSRVMLCLDSKNGGGKLMHASSSALP